MNPFCFEFYDLKEGRKEKKRKKRGRYKEEKSEIKIKSIKTASKLVENIFSGESVDLIKGFLRGREVTRKLSQVT